MDREGIQRAPKPEWSRSAWVDTARRIISFTPQKDFQKLNFPSHQEMLDYAVTPGPFRVWDSVI